MSREIENHFQNYPELPREARSWAADNVYHTQHNDHPDETDPQRPGRYCGPSCDLYESPDPVEQIRTRLQRPQGPTWRCGNRGCSHPFSKSWHRRMADNILANAGQRTLEDFEGAHPDPDLIPCDDCGLVGRHNLDIEH